MSEKPMNRQNFYCYLCQEECKKRQKALVVGSGMFTEFICKKCARNNYVIYGSDEELPRSVKVDSYGRYY